MVVLGDKVRKDLKMPERPEGEFVQLGREWFKVIGVMEPRGEVFSGEAGCRLSRDPDTTVGIDVVYFDAQTLAVQPEDTTLLEGIPKLAVEVLSPSDTVENINEKVDTYLAHRVPLVWLVDPHNRTILVHRPEAEPDMFNVTQEISGEPVMPGFRVAVARIFGR